jgi:hypothetical protein
MEDCVNHTELPAFGWQVESAVPEDEPLFQPFPPEIHFHGYKAFERYEALVYLRNNDKVSYSNRNSSAASWLHRLSKNVLCRSQGQ